MSGKILAFNNDGLLEPGDYEMTFAELRNSLLVLGPENPDECSSWHSSWRRELVDNLEMLTRQLWQVGITEVFADGSFVEEKDHPNDIDGYFVCERDFLLSGDLEQELNKLDPQSVWTWDPNSRKPYPGYGKRQLPMWHVYRVELYPHVPGLYSGIKDEHGNELEFPAAFRRSRSDGEPRGIIKLRDGGES